jgi:hypothetical protein
MLCNMISFCCDCGGVDMPVYSNYVEYTIIDMLVQQYSIGQ